MPLPAPVHHALWAPLIEKVWAWKKPELHEVSWTRNLALSTLVNYSIVAKVPTLLQLNKLVIIHLFRLLVALLDA